VTASDSLDVDRPTYEDVVAQALRLLVRTGALRGPCEVPWDAFYRLSDVIHDVYDVPATSFTPIMRRLVFALGFAIAPRHVVGVGTYVGYTFSWLLRDRQDRAGQPFCASACGVDIDPNATLLARRNCASLNHGKRLRFICADGRAALARWRRPIDLLYLDLDDVRAGKGGYLDSLASASPALCPGAVVLAHDPCLPRFDEDFRTYHQYIKDTKRFTGPWILPVDACGLSIAVAQ
jgi:predicted O-methyltransferase YrrM